ncbi:retrovirus-related pol polyprotein from transposon TNT 1-94 [Tanacetum coccineum]
MQQPLPNNNNNYNPQPSFNQNYMQQLMPNPEDITNPTTAMNMTLADCSAGYEYRSRQTYADGWRQWWESVSIVCWAACQESGCSECSSESGCSESQAASNAIGNNGNQIRCYNCRGLGHLARNCIVRPRRMDAASLHTQLLIAQKEEAGIQLQAEEFDLMATAADLDEIEETDQLSVEQDGETVDQHPASVEETRSYFESLYNNLVIKVEKVNSVNRKMKETNADLTTELARYKNQEKCFEISQEKYDKLERCYQKSVYQEQCLTKKINALHLSSGKQITTLNEEISNLSKQLSTEKSTVSSLLEEKKKLKSDFKIREDELLDKQIQLENKIKELDNILVKTGQSIQTMHMLSPKPDSFYHTEQKMALGYQNPFYLKQAQRKQQSLYNGKVLLEKHDPPVVHDSEETLQLAQESRQKMKQLNKEIKPANYTKINHLSGIFVSQTAKSQEEV